MGWKASTLLCCLLPFAAAYPSQHALHTLPELAPAPQTVTLVDVLSSDKDFSLFIRLLQRARLVPTLNKLKNATVFAPTNDAIRAHELMMGYLDSNELEPQRDNLQYRLRERLFYHMLNYSLDIDTIALPALPNGPATITYQTTLLFPTTHEEHGRPGHVPYPDPEDTLLGGEGQKVVISRQYAQDGSRNATVIIGQDELGNGGTNVLQGKGGLARNGRVYAVNAILEPPKSLQHQVQARSHADKPKAGEASLSRFASLLTEDLWKTLLERSHLTLFAPRDEAFDALEPLEWRYLNSGFADDDILQIASNHESEYGEEGREKVGYLDRLLQKQTLPLLSGDSVSVVASNTSVSVNNSVISTANILASNGVMHIVDSLLLPYGSLALTPEKYLLALNATRFVSLFRNSDLAYLLQSSPHNPANNGSYTILATKDSVIERMTQSPYSSLPPEGSTELKETLKYHVIQGKWTPQQLKDGQLLKTMLQTSDLGDQQQRIAVSVSESTKSNAWMTKEKSLDLGFGDANVIDEAVDIGSSIIYLVSRIIEPPSTFIATALDRGLSTYVATVYAAGLDRELLYQRPATTYIAPTNTAFDYLGLAMNYFLLSSAKEELAQLLKYHAVKGIRYIKEIAYDSQHYPTLEGSDIYLERKNATSRVHIRGPRIGGFPANGDNRDARVIDGDLLTSTGVLHVVDQLELPPTLNVTSEKLMRGAKASTFLDLLQQANLSWIAESRPAPEGYLDSLPFMGVTKRGQDRIRKHLFQHQSYTILCPTDKAFTHVNLTYYLNDMPALLALVRLHIIPSPPPSRSSISDPMTFPSDGRPLALTDESTFATLLSQSQGGTSKYGDVAFRQAGDSDWVVGIKGARYTNSKHDAARIINFGRNTPIFNQDEVEVDMLKKPKMVFGGGVLLIDGVLEPFEPNWFQRWGHIVLIVVVSVLATACISILAWKLWQRKKMQDAQYEAVRQDNEED